MLRSLFLFVFVFPLVLLAVSPSLSIFVCKSLELGEICNAQQIGFAESVYCVALFVLGFLFKRVYDYLYPGGDEPEQCGCATAFLNGGTCLNRPLLASTKCSSLCSEILPGGECNCPCPACSPEDVRDQRAGFFNHAKLWIVRQIVRWGLILCLVLSFLPFMVRLVWDHVTVLADVFCLWVLVIFSLLAKPWIGVTVFFSGFLVAEVGAVCIHCNDQLEGCMGGDTCAFVAGTNSNAVLVSTVGTLAVGAALSVGSMLPRAYLAVLTRSTLDSLLALTRRVLPGAAVSLAGKTIDQLLVHARDGSAPPRDIIGELSGLIPGASADERDMIKLAMDAVKAYNDFQKTPATTSSTTGETVGVLRYLWALSGKIVLRGNSTATIVLDRDAGVSGAQRLSEKIHRPESAEQFTDMLFTFAAICHALGVCNFLLWTTFARAVVFDVMLQEGYSWSFAHELLMVYFEDIDGSATLNFKTIMEDGSTDRRRRLAEVNLKTHYPKVDIFRPAVSNGDGGGGGGGGGKKEWNGRFTKGNSQRCADWNAGNPCTRLHPNGTCRYNHICDHWIVGQGKDAMCGLAHPRCKCTNPDKGTRQTE